MPRVDMLKVLTTPSGVPTSHARTVLAASAPAVEAQRGTGRMGHLARPWQDSNLHGAGARTGGRTRVTRTSGVHDAATARALVPMIEQPGECVTGESVDMVVRRVLRQRLRLRLLLLLLLLLLIIIIMVIMIFSYY